MGSLRKKYIGLFLVLLVTSAAGLLHAESTGPCCHGQTVQPDHGERFVDAVIAGRYHQSHFKRFRFEFDGCPPVQQDMVLRIVTVGYAVAPVWPFFILTPARPSLRGPPVV